MLTKYSFPVLGRQEVLKHKQNNVHVLLFVLGQSIGNDFAHRMKLYSNVTTDIYASLTRAGYQKIMVLQFTYN